MPESRQCPGLSRDPGFRFAEPKPQFFVIRITKLRPKCLTLGTVTEATSIFEALSLNL